MLIIAASACCISSSISISARASCQSCGNGAKNAALPVLAVTVSSNASLAEGDGMLNSIAFMAINCFIFSSNSIWATMAGLAVQYLRGQSSRQQYSISLLGHSSPTTSHSSTGLVMSSAVQPTKLASGQLKIGAGLGAGVTTIGERVLGTGLGGSVGVEKEVEDAVGGEVAGAVVPNVVEPEVDEAVGEIVLTMPPPSSSPPSGKLMLISCVLRAMSVQKATSSSSPPSPPWTIRSRLRRLLLLIPSLPFLRRLP
mmetsp:Transcript_33796/g.81691  ORF Transcript_33796/g.81691 Transcript_33796/m.81691 type:complete len:255 (-) Transcript_33796:226-990(-)